MTTPSATNLPDLPESLVIERELGRGGMATVYLARDLKHGREVALKVMRPEVGLAVGEGRFQREIRIAAGLQHPHILPVLDSGVSGQRLWYTMPLVRGGSLRERLECEGLLEVDEALRIAGEVAEALGHAHAQGIVHRDIKPENILFSGGHALIADFGIARAIHDAGEERLTQTHMSLGTPEYMSPEQSLGERDLDGRSDLYALAVVLYEMLAGEPPFTGPNMQAILARRLSEPAPPIRATRDTVPEPVEAALARALAREPADRFGDTDEFIAALTTYTPLPPPPGGRTRASGGLARAAVGATVVTLLVGGWWGLRRWPHLPADASVIAVLPLTPSSSDTMLERLGRDLATTMSASLDGITDLRTIDRLTVLAQVPEHAASLTIADAVSLGRRLGASSVIHGSLTRDGNRVRVDLGLYSGEPPVPLTRLTVVAIPESLSALTDSLTRGLLADIWRRGTPPTPTLQAALATRSLGALRAYLDGERHLVAGQYRLARAAYSRAIESDSSFWFAYYRYGNAMGWSEQDIDPAVERAYWDHRQLLPERERRLIEASRADSGLSRQYARLKAVVQRWPDYWPAWWMLADNLHHAYPSLGTGRPDARKALEQVVRLNPSMVYPWQHLGMVYAQERDTAGLARTIEALDRLHARETFLENEQTDYLLLSRSILAALTHSPAAAGLLDSVYRQVAAGLMPPFIPSIYLSYQGFGADQATLDRRLLEHRLSAEEARDVATHLSLTWAMRGAWDSALRWHDRLAPSPGDRLWVVDAYRIAVAGAWVGGLPVSEARRRRAAVDRLGLPTPGQQAELAWLDGVLAAAASDADGLRDARTRLKQSGARWAAFLGRSLGAFQSALAGDPRSAGGTMAALERELADSSPWFAYSGATPHPMLRGIDRVAAAEWLLSAGDSVAAVPLLTWHEAAGGPFYDKFPLAPLAYLLQARIADGRGDTAVARGGYQQFLTRYDAAAPGLRHLVIEAQEALARLAGAPVLPADR